MLKSSCLLLAVSLIPLVCGCEYSSSVALHRSKSKEPDSQHAFAWEELEASYESPPVVLIDSPHEGEIIGDDVYHQLSWRAFDVPRGKRFVVFASDNYNYFLMYPFPRVGREADSFEQRNIRLATPGEWQLHVCLANSSAVSTLSSCARRGQWDFVDLPIGIEPIETVLIERRKNK